MCIELWLLGIGDIVSECERLILIGDKVRFTSKGLGRGTLKGSGSGGCTFTLLGGGSIICEGTLKGTGGCTFTLFGGGSIICLVRVSSNGIGSW